MYLLDIKQMCAIFLETFALGGYELFRESFQILALSRFLNCSQIWKVGNSKVVFEVNFSITCHVN